MVIRQLTDKAQILSFLETDRNYAAYAIGDLEPGFFEQSVWHAVEKNGKICALALMYAGFEPPILFLLGEAGGVAALLAGPVRIEHASPMAQEQHVEVLGRYYRWNAGDLWPMWRMVLHNFQPVETLHAASRRLTPNDVEHLGALYALGGGDAFTAEQVAQGVFYGIEQAGQLVSTAGTHLVSEHYGVAAVGNVMTHPDYRGRGYAAAVTSAVCAELVRRGIQTIVLNVGQDNFAAQRVYEKLGFVRHCAFYEGIIERNNF